MFSNTRGMKKKQNKNSLKEWRDFFCFLFHGGMKKT